MRRTTAIMSSCEIDTKSGEELHFEKCKGGYFSTLKEYGLKVVGKTEQDGTPTPDAPIDIRCVKRGTEIRILGMNLFPNVNSSTSAGITYSLNDDGTVTVDGTSTGYAISRTYSMTLRSGVYRVSGSSSGVMVLAKYKLDGSDKYTQASFTLQNDTKVSLYLQVNPNITVNNVTVFPMLIRGDKDVPYETYRLSGKVITPCDLYEGDIWYPMSGLVERHSKRIELTGNEAWEMQWSTAYHVWTLPVEGLKAHGFSTFFQGKCTHYPRSHNTEAYNKTIDKGIWARGGNSEYMCITDFGIADLTSFKAMLADRYASGEPVSVIYQLSEPEFEQYVPQAVFAPCGAVNMMQTCSELAAELEATVFIK